MVERSPLEADSNRRSVRPYAGFVQRRRQRRGKARPAYCAELYEARVFEGRRQGGADFAIVLHADGECGKNSRRIALMGTGTRCWP